MSFKNPKSDLSRRQWLLGTLVAGIGISIAGTSALAGGTIYKYDDLGRLVQAAYTNGMSANYTYDIAGNRVSVVNRLFVGASLTADGFDAEYYRLIYPDMLAANPTSDFYAHYANFGWHEGRNPSAYFNTQGYLNAYTDIKNAGINPFDHYNQHGWKEGRPGGHPKTPTCGHFKNTHLKP